MLFEIFTLAMWLYLCLSIFCLFLINHCGSMRVHLVTLQLNWNLPSSHYDYAFFLNPFLLHTKTISCKCRDLIIYMTQHLCNLPTEWRECYFTYSMSLQLGFLGLFGLLGLLGSLITLMCCECKTPLDPVKHNCQIRGGAMCDYLEC